MCCPTEKVKTRTCGRACTEGHPLGTLVFHTQCSQPMTTSPGTVWHCLPWPTECVQMDRRLLQVLAARESLSLLAWPQPVLSPSITVLAQATYPSGPRSGASLLPEGSELSEDDIWARTLPPHRFPGTGQQQGPSCWFCLPASSPVPMLEVCSPQDQHSGSLPAPFPPQHPTVCLVPHLLHKKVGASYKPTTRAAAPCRSRLLGREDDEEANGAEASKGAGVAISLHSEQTQPGTQPHSLSPSYWASCTSQRHPALGPHRHP